MAGIPVSHRFPDDFCAVRRSVVPVGLGFRVAHPNLDATAIFSTLFAHVLPKMYLSVPPFENLITLGTLYIHRHLFTSDPLPL